MIELATGNLLEAEAEALVNTVNCVGVMGRGIALQFKQAYPDNYKAYHRACQTGEMQPGTMLVVPTGSMVNPKYIINFPTKRHWKGKSRLSDIDSGLISLVAEIARLGIHSIAIPPLGCGNGGLDWSDVRPRIQTAFAALPDVKVLLFAPAAAPASDQMPVATDLPSMTRSRALFIKLIQRYRNPGYRLTLLEIQKLAYFLQVAGEPLRLNFVKHLYGPYAENLNHVLQRIEGHFIRGYGDRSKGEEISLVTDAVEQADTVLATDSASQDRLERIFRLIEGLETPYGMELLATVHWVAAHDPTAAGDVSAAIVGVQSWNKRKAERYQPDHIRIAWERLRDQAWFATT